MLFLDRADVAALLNLPECMSAVERAFAAHAAGELPAAPGVLESQVEAGGFHVKTAAIGGNPGYYAAKINSYFPGNPELHGWPAIQGLIALFDTATGRPLALLDSIEITILRTAAASAIAARFLARDDAATLLICGCGTQGRAHLRALSLVRPPRRVLAFHRDPARARAFAESFPHCDIGVTCTPAREALPTPDDIRPGQFIAGQRPARTSDEQIFVFDSTGTALQDVAAAAVVYERALAAR